MDPPRAKPRLLNKALLSEIASTAVGKQMRSAGWMGAIENKVAELYARCRSLKLVGTSCRQNLDHLLRIVAENDSSLKVLSDVPEPLFGRLPSGLMLDEFSACGIKPGDVKIPALNTKVFKYNVAEDIKIPVEFMRTLNSEEIHMRIYRLLPENPENPQPFIEEPANYRTKKLRVEFADEHEGDLDFDRMFREVAVCCPNLESFELVHEERFDTRSTYGDFAGAVDDLVARFERALKEADTAPYEVQLKIHVGYTHDSGELLPVETDFKCGLFKSDVPPSVEVEPGKQHSYFVKETSADGKNFRVDCEIVQGSERFDDYSDYVYDGGDGDDYYEDYYDRYDSDDDRFGGPYFTF